MTVRTYTCLPCDRHHRSHRCHGTLSGWSDRGGPVREAELYVSVDTDQRENSVNTVVNRTTADTWELFKIEKMRYYPETFP